MSDRIFLKGSRFTTTQTHVYDDGGAGLPDMWERQNGSVIVPAGTEGVVIDDEGGGRGSRRVRFDGCEDHHIHTVTIWDLSPVNVSLSRIDDPDATLVSLVGRVIPGCHSEYSNILKSLAVRPDSSFGLHMPTITLRRVEDHNSTQRWSAFVEEFHCGWYGATPREALAALCDQWHNQSGRARALHRIDLMDDLVCMFS